MTEFELISSINEDVQKIELKNKELWKTLESYIKHNNIILIENIVKEIKENNSKKSIYEEILRRTI